MTDDATLHCPQLVKRSCQSLTSTACTTFQPRFCIRQTHCQPMMSPVVTQPSITSRRLSKAPLPSTPLATQAPTPGPSAVPAPHPSTHLPHNSHPQSYTQATHRATARPLARTPAPVPAHTGRQGPGSWAPGQPGPLLGQVPPWPPQTGQLLLLSLVRLPSARRVYFQRRLQQRRRLLLLLLLGRAVAARLLRCSSC
jgi:hypothetical protein